MTTKEHKGDGTPMIIGCAIKVSASLGSGFLERVYEAALMHELQKAGLRAESQVAFAVRYDGVVVGEYRADLVVDDRIVVEVKAAKAIDPAHQAQPLNYLRASGLRIGLILNFGTPRLGIKRMVI
ncbi:MAG TPA: GxxExxY protein [Candidatus Dormibacteraeota bacterium]|nr:GxxExxY protein [Candidatus Dormibacteraeota bacterium]